MTGYKVQNINLELEAFGMRQLVIFINLNLGTKKNKNEAKTINCKESGVVNLGWWNVYYFVVFPGTLFLPGIRPKITKCSCFFGFFFFF